MSLDQNNFMGMFGAVAGAGQTLYNNQYNERMIIEGRNYDRKEYDRTYKQTRDDALADRDYNNKYNSPEQQMVRLRLAGLNPHLVYGNGAQMTASQIRDANPNTRNSPVNRMERAPNPVQDYMGIQSLQAQTNLTQAQTELTRSNTETSKYDLGLKHELRDTTLTAAKLQNLHKTAEIENVQTGTRKLRADIVFTLDSNERQRLANTANVAKTLQEISLIKIEKLVKAEAMAKSKQEREHIRAQIELNKHIVEKTKNEVAIQDLEKRLANKGMTKSDPIYWRALVDMIQQMTR